MRVCFYLFVALAYVLLILSVDCLAQGNSSSFRSIDTANQNTGICFFGKLYSSKKRNVHNQAAGSIRTLNIPIGGHVKRRDRLARIDLKRSDYLQYMQDVSTDSLYNIETQIMSNDANIRAIQSRIEEVHSLIDKDLATVNDLANLDSELSLLQKKRDSLMRQKKTIVEEIDDNIKRIRRVLGNEVDRNIVPSTFDVKAPISGVVLDVNGKIRPGMKIPKGTHIVTIGVLDTLIIKGKLFETDAKHIEIGAAALFSVRAVPDRIFKAKVTYLSQTPISKDINQPSYYEVELETSNPDLVLLEGYVAEVFVPN